MNDKEKYTRELAEGSPPGEPLPVVVREARPAKDEYVAAGHATDDGAGFLQAFLKAHPFCDLFEHIADRFFSGKTDQIRNAKCKAAHPAFYHFCIWADIVVRWVVVIILIALATWAAYKIVS